MPKMFVTTELLCRGGKVEIKHLHWESTLYLHQSLEDSNFIELISDTITLVRDDLGKGGKLPSFPKLPLQLASAIYHGNV